MHQLLSRGFVEMDLLRLPMKGGAIEFADKYPYKFRTIDELKDVKKNKDKDYLNIDDPTKQPEYAVFIVNTEDNETSVDSLTNLTETQMENVIGASWYAVLKLIHDVEQLKGTEGWTDAKKNFVKKFFTVADKDTSGTGDPGSNEDKDPNAGKKVIIGFIHGLYSYFRVNANAGETIPELNSPISERYEWVINKMNNVNSTMYGKIWQHLGKQLVVGEKADVDVNYDILYLTDDTKDQFETFIRAEKQTPNNASTVISYNINDIAFQQPIHSVLLKYRKIFSSD